ncbi:MAG: DUF5024 domain-containing protein [Muribaculaceae bacterium]|nr:DUF5024 domain-containing protein [Muribaculaceae bacterium]
MKNIIILLIITVCGISAAAQARIDRVVKSIEHNKDVEMTYSERRTPKRHKICRITKVLSFNSTKYYDKLVNAFEGERENTVSAMRTKDSFIYHFEDNRAESKYTLQSTPGHNGSSTSYTFVMTWRDKEQDRYGTTGDIIDQDGVIMSHPLQSLSSLEELHELRSLDKLKELRQWGDEVRRLCRHQTETRSSGASGRDSRSRTRCRTVTATDADGNTVTTVRYYESI